MSIKLILVSKDLKGYFVKVVDDIAQINDKSALTVKSRYHIVNLCATCDIYF